MLNITNHQESVNQTTMRYHLTTVRVAIIKKTTNNKYLQGCEEKRTLYTVGENVNWCSHYAKYYRGSQKLKIKLPYDRAIPLLCIYLKVTKTLTQKKMQPYVLCSIIYNSQDMETI